MDLVDQSNMYDIPLWTIYNIGEPGPETSAVKKYRKNNLRERIALVGKCPNTSYLYVTSHRIQVKC